MKKLILPILFAVFLTACSDNAVETSADNTEATVTESSYSETSETPTETTTETTTQATTETTTETTTQMTTETTTETTTEAEPEINSPWEIRYYVDDFNRPTDEFYISGVFDGTFSNSATTNADLDVAISVSRYTYDGSIYDSIDFALFEYGRSKVKNYYSHGAYYDIQVLEENDNIISEEGVIYSEGSYLYFNGDKDKNSIIKALKSNSSVMIRIDEQDGMSSYLFTVDCTGFKDLFESADWNL